MAKLNLIFDTNFNLLTLEARWYFLMLKELSDKQGHINGKYALDKLLDCDDAFKAIAAYHPASYTCDLTIELLDSGFIEEAETEADVEYQIVKEYRK